MNTYRVAKENTDGITTERGISRRSSARGVDQWVAAQAGGCRFWIGLSTLHSWIPQDRRNPEKPTVHSGLERDTAALRKENRLFREERDVLRKAKVFFAERSK
ncbi:MAG: hypothetical protein AAF415_09410 [Pseudomonadota bacterium]